MGIQTQPSTTFLRLTGDIKQWLINNGYQSSDQLIVPHNSLPNNFAIANKNGVYSEFVKLQRFNWDSVNGFASTVIHPAFMVGGVEREIFIGKYQACLLTSAGLVDNTSGLTAGSRRNVEQKSSVDFDTALALCAANNAGAIAGFHLITNAEWAALQIKSINGSTQPHGNTNYGRDDRDPSIVGRCYTLANFGAAVESARWLTGSGGIKTSHNHQADGVFDLSGNVWEWVGGLRLYNGEINILVTNNAADATKSQLVGSAEWLAILEDGTLVAPGTADTLKFYSNGNITKAATSGSGSKTFESITVEADVSAASAGVELLKKLGVYPYTTGYNGDYFWYNNASEFIPLRGGACDDVASAGVSALRLFHVRGYVRWDVGFRLAFVL